MKGYRHQTLHVVRQRRVAEQLLLQRIARVDVCRRSGLAPKVVARIAAQLKPHPLTADEVAQARAELRTGARRCYLMAAQLREALGLPPRPSLIQAEDPEPGLCAYCGVELPVKRLGRPTLYCSSTCEFNTSRIRSLESRGSVKHTGAPRGSVIDQELRLSVRRHAARLLVRGAEWGIVAAEFGLDERDRQAIRELERAAREQGVAP